MDTPQPNTFSTPGVGPVKRARASVEALRVLHMLESEQRTPTDDEREVLRGWSGWGPLSKALDPEPAASWKEMAGELQELLTPSQLQQGLEACFNSFYTPPELTQACWDLLTGLGFQQGRILEPGCGSGHFIAATPEGVDASWLGVEADEVSAAIARHLNPQAMVVNKPMEEANLPDHSVDAVIGNVPFGEVRVYDPSAPAEVTRTLHDYMIWSSVRTLAPGGVAVLITSCGTLDKLDHQARQAIDAEAVLVGAVRLPNGALSSLGTDTAADILILRRRTGEEPWRNPSAPAPKELPEDPVLAANAQGLWVNTGESMNQWLERFSDDMVLGTMGKNVYRTGVTEVTPHQDEPWAQGLRRAVETTIERAQVAELTSQTLAAPVSMDQVLNQREDALKEGQILTVERPVTTRGKTRTVPVLARVAGGVVEEVRAAPSKEQKKHDEPGNLKPATKELLALIELRDAAVALFEADADLEGVSDAELAPMRERALGLYQAYADTYGPIGRCEIKHRTETDDNGVELVKETIKTPDLGGMRQDVDLSTLLALEHYTLASNTAKPADILYQRINAPAEAVVVADSPHDAVALSLNEYNRVDEPYVASLLGVPASEVAEVLIEARAAFRDPAQPQGELVPAATYLSGAVGHKLEVAQAAAEQDPAWEGNVQALTAARPEPLPPEKIVARLGAQWIPPEVIREFAREVLKIDCRVSTTAATGEWDVKVDSQAKDAKRAVTNCEMWAYTPPRPQKGEIPRSLVGYIGSGPLRRGDELLASALNNKPPTIKYWVDDEKTSKHDRFSREASKAQERLQRRFSTWVWQDPARARAIAQAFNRDFQSTVPNEPDGSRLTFPGMSSVIDPYKHQLDFVAMSLSRPSAAAIHDMGGGKTATMFMTAIKHVQLGLATNPIIVVPNGLREDITRAGKQLFPSARILMATDEDLKGPEARRRFAYKCAANRWDAIVMTEPMYTKLPVHEKSEAAFHDRHKATLMATLGAEAAGKTGAQAKKIGKKIKARAARAKALLSQTNADDNTTYFEHLGSTMVLYDEATDWMRNLGEFIKVEGVPMSSPYNAAQGYLKMQTLLLNGGKAMLFTGTPMVKNLMDLYSIILSTNEEGLHARGIYNAEQFARTFARFEDVLEPTADGQDVNVRRRIKEPINKDQLLALFGESCHLRLNLGLKVPDVDQYVHTVEGTPEQRAHAQDLAYRETQIRGWRSQKGDDTYLSLVAEGRASALDPTLVGLDTTGPTKLDLIAESVAQRYGATKDHTFPEDPPGVQGALQVVFMSQGVPHGKDPRSYGRLRAKLVEQGVPAERIRFVHDYDAGPQRARLYEDCRAGKVSVLIGSFPKMGYGVNIQDRLSDIHVADVGWNPADLRQAIKRGHRPGNLNERMGLHYYPVKGTIDARFFALNEQRRRVEEAFFNAGGETGTIGEISASEMGSLSTVAADNPRLEELTKLKESLEGLEDDARLHESMLAQASAGIAERELDSARLTHEADNLAHLVKVVGDHPSTQARAGDQGPPLTDKGTHQRLNEATRRALSRERNSTAGTAITYRGLRVSVRWAPSTDSPDKKTDAFAVLSHPDHPGIEHHLPLREAWTRKGQTHRLTAAITRGIDHLDRYVQGLHTQIQELAQADASAREILSQEFEGSQDLQVLQAEVASLEAELVRETHDLAERAAKVEALALTDVEVLSKEHGVSVGYDPHGQMAVDMDVDQVPVLRPPSGWHEQATPGLSRTERAVQGTHWTLTHQDAPFDAPVPFTAHIRSTLSGQVHAQIDITPQYGPMRGHTNTVSQGHFATYGDALLSVRSFLGSRLGSRAEKALSFDVQAELFSRHPGTREQFAKIPAVEQTWWSQDIARLATVSPLTMLDVAEQEGHPALPDRERWWPGIAQAAPARIKDFNGRYVLVRTHAGRLQAVDVNVDYDGSFRLPGGTRLAREWIAEILDLESTLGPAAPRRFLDQGQEPRLSASMLWSAMAHSGDATDPGTISLRRSLHSAAGLNAIGHDVEFTLDQRLLGRNVAEGVENLSVRARLVEVDDTHLVLRLPFAIPHQSLHELPVDLGADPIERLRSTAGQQPLFTEGQRKAPEYENKPFTIRVPMVAVANMEACGQTWTNTDVQQALKRAEERRQKAAEAQEEQASPTEIEPLTLPELATWVRELRKSALGLSEQGMGHLSWAEQYLTSPHEADVVAAYTALALGLEDTLDVEVEATGLLRVVEQVANALTEQQDYTAAVRLRERFADQARDLEAWREVTADIADLWASTFQGGEVPTSAATLLNTPPEVWEQTKEDFARAREALRDCLVQGEFGYAHHLRAAIRTAYVGRVSQDWDWKGLQQHYASATITAAHLHSLPDRDERLRELPFPYGLGGLIGHDVVVLAEDGQAYPAKVQAVNARFAMATDDGRTWGTHEVRQVRTTDNRLMVLADGEPGEMEQALADLGQLWRSERDALIEPFHEALQPLIGRTIQVYGSRSLINEGALEALTPTGVRLRSAEGMTAVSFEDIGSVQGPERARWWVDPAADAIEQHLDTTRRLLEADAHPLARRHVKRAFALINQIQVAPSVRDRWHEMYADLVGQAFAPTQEGQLQVQIERSGPQERTVKVYGAAGASPQVRAVIDGAMNASPALTWSAEEQAHVGDPNWRQGMIQARLDQLREDLTDAGIGHSSVNIPDPEPDLTDPEVVAQVLIAGEPTPATSASAPAPSAQVPEEPSSAQTRPSPRSQEPDADSASAGKEPTPEQPLGPLTDSQDALFQAAEHQGVLMMDTIGADHFAPAAPTTTQEAKPAVSATHQGQTIGSVPLDPRVTMRIARAVLRERERELWRDHPSRPPLGLPAPADFLTPQRRSLLTQALWAKGSELQTRFGGGARYALDSAGTWLGEVSKQEERWSYAYTDSHPHFTQIRTWEETRDAAQAARGYGDPATSIRLLDSYLDTYRKSVPGRELREQIVQECVEQVGDAATQALAPYRTQDLDQAWEVLHRAQPHVEALQLAGGPQANKLCRRWGTAREGILSAQEILHAPIDPDAVPGLGWSVHTRTLPGDRTQKVITTPGGHPLAAVLRNTEAILARTLTLQNPQRSAALEQALDGYRNSPNRPGAEHVGALIVELAASGAVDEALQANAQAQESGPADHEGWWARNRAHLRRQVWQLLTAPPEQTTAAHLPTESAAAQEQAAPEPSLTKDVIQTEASEPEPASAEEPQKQTTPAAPAPQVAQQPPTSEAGQEVVDERGGTLSTPAANPTQLSARPELRTDDFHAANQAIKDALKNGDLPTAQRIHEFRIDPREGRVPNAAQQPGYELFTELADALRGAPSVDEVVVRVIYRAWDADLKLGDRAEALRLLTLAEEISPEGGEHTAEARQIRASLEARDFGERPAFEDTAPKHDEEPPVPDEHPSREEDATYPKDSALDEKPEDTTAFPQGDGSEGARRLHDATRALQALGADPSPERRDELNAALQGLLDYAQHTDVQRLTQDADQVDPAGRWDRADLLSIARFAQDPDGLAAAIRLDYDGSKTTVIRLTGDDGERPVRELLKDKSGPYKARYDGKSRHWQIKRRRPSVEDYRELLSDLVEDLADLGHTWVTEKAHNQLAERHRAQTEAALSAAGTVAAVNSDGHVGELADVLTYPALRVSAVIRHKDDQGEPADSWTVVYDTGQGAELTERTTTEPDVRRGQTLTDVRVKIHDHAFSAQGDARTIIIRVPPQGKRSFPLTAEQEQIRASALDGRKVVVQAGAGTGKTATMGVVAETLAEQGRKGVYVVYGRANADEAALKLAHVPIATNTIHAFARRAVGGPYNERINGDRQPNWRRTADDLGLGPVVLPSGHPMDGEDLARLLDRTIQAFELSADLDLTTSRIPRLPGLSERDHSHVQRILEPLLDRAWADMCNPGGTLFRFRHDTYVKIWQLTPGGPKMHIGGQGQPYLLADEAQDMNPVAEAILQAQTHMQQIWVGDSAQAIHGWRGAKDALVNQNPDVEHSLSQSFRFGEAVAAEANRWLGAIDAPLRVKGTPNLDTVVHDRVVEAPDAVLARTNAGAFNAALDQLQRGRRVAIVGGTDDLTKLVDAADKLREGKRTTHPDLSHFRSWGGVVKVVNERPEDLGSLAPFVRLVDKLGTDKVREALSQMTDTEPDVEVCTAHKSKGLEWDRVQIADDFAPKEEHPWSPEEFKAEAQLAYVATTRARKELGRGSLSYIDTYLGSSAPSSTEHVQQQDEDLTPAEPAAEQDSVPQVEGKAESPETPVQDRGTEAEPSPSGPEQPEPSTPQTPSSNEVSPAPQDDYIVSIPLQGELEETEYIRQARQVARALPEELRQALLQPRNAPMGQGHGPGVDWSQTPVEHLDALQERGMAMTTATGERYLTQYGYNVSRLLNRMLHGPDTDLMNPSADQEIVVDTTQEPEQQPSQSDQAPQAEPTPQSGTPAQAGEDPQLVADQLTRNLQRALTQNLDEHGHLRMAHRAEGTRRAVIDQGLVHFDATSDVYTLTPWGERVREALREGPAAGQDLSGGPVQNQPSEPQREPARDPDIHRFLETLDSWGTWFEDGRQVYTLGSGESFTAEEIRERFLTSQQEEIGPDPQVEAGPAELDAFVESERTIYDELADMEELTPEEEAALEAPVAPSTDEHAAPHEEAPTTEAPAPTVPPEQNQPPVAESAADPERQTSGPAEVDPELNSEANRARAARGKGPLRRGKLTLELPDDPQEQQRRQATIEVGTATATAAAVNRPPAPTALEHSEGPEPRQGQVSTTDPGAHQQTGEGPTRIDGRQIRAEDNQWQKIWEKQGRAEARRLTDPVVYDKMRTQFRQALASDRDVHLVMPSNDPAMVKEFINIAREHGYEITLKAAIPPNPMWALGVAEQLHNQIQQGTPERAMSLPECRAEYTNLRQILRDVHSEHLVDRLELYPREGVTTDTTPVIRDHLIGTPDNPQWSLNTPIEKHINALDSAQVTDSEDGRLRTRVAEMVEQLPSINEVPEHQRWAHEQVNEVLNFIERTNNERQPYKDTARRTTMNIGGQEQDESPHADHSQAPHREEPSQPEEPHPHEAEHEEVREPAMAGGPTPSREEALNASHTPRPGQGVRRPPPSPKHEYGAPTHQAGATPRARQGPRP